MGSSVRYLMAAARSAIDVGDAHVEAPQHGQSIGQNHAFARFFKKTEVGKTRRPEFEAVGDFLAVAHDAHHEAAARRLDGVAGVRSEEQTSELQSRQYLVCRLLL